MDTKRKMVNLEVPVGIVQEDKNGCCESDCGVCHSIDQFAAELESFNNMHEAFAELHGEEDSPVPDDEHGAAEEYSDVDEYELKREINSLKFSDAIEYTLMLSTYAQAYADHFAKDDPSLKLELLRQFTNDFHLLYCHHL